MKLAKLDLTVLASLTGAEITNAATSEFSAIDAFIAKRGPYLGALRYFAKIREVSLADLIEKYGSYTRKAFENAKCYADILAFFGAAVIPSAAFDAIPRAKARDLCAIFPALKKDTATLEKVQKYLTGPCKFRDGWIEHVISLMPVMVAVESTTEAETESEPETLTTGEGEGGTLETSTEETGATIAAMPAPAPMKPAEFIELAKDRLREMSDKDREITRGMLARLVNEPAKLAEYLAA